MIRTLTVAGFVVLAAGLGLARVAADPASVGPGPAAAPAQEKEADDEAKPRYSIKQIMAEAHKGGLFNKVSRGQGSKEDKLKLLDYYVALFESTPKKGKPEGWAKASGQALAAAAKLVIDEKAEASALRKAVNCKACHDLYK